MAFPLWVNSCSHLTILSSATNFPPIFLLTSEASSSVVYRKKYEYERPEATRPGPAHADAFEMLISPRLNAYKTQDFDVIQKRNIYYKDTYQQHASEISKQYLYFWLAMAKKVNVMTLVFETTQCLALVIVIRETTLIFWNPQPKWTSYVCFCKKILILEF